MKSAKNAIFWELKNEKFLSNKKLIKNKSRNRFSAAVFIILLSMLISLFAFVSEDNKTTGFVTIDNNQEIVRVTPPTLIEFKNINSITLSAGNYYVDENGFVYWTDDESRPAIAKVKFVDDSQKERYIYIDDEGSIGYMLNPVSIK